MDTWFERMTALDALFLELEDRGAHMHVGALAVFEGAPPPHRDLLRLVEARLPSVPRYRQRVLPVPFRQGRPVWVDETQFDLEYHVRRTALPAPGGAEELKKLAGRLFSQALDRDKPLWELWLVEGLAKDRFALISKTHHCMLDGVSGIDLATVLLDIEPAAEPPPAPPAFEPRGAPERSALLAAAMKENVLHPLRLLRDATQSNSDARKLLGEAVGGLKGLFGLAQMGMAPASSLNRPIGPHRRFETLDLALADVKAVRAALGGTINDVLLAVVAGALRSWLLARGEAPSSDLRVLVPVSMRAEEGRGKMGNQVSAVFCPLPVGEPSPLERLHKVSAAMKGLKESGLALGAHALSRIGDFAPPTLLAQAARLQAVTRFFNLVVTNVPGPQFPLYLLGRRLLRCYPQVPLAAQQTVGIALLSYDGNIGVGLLGDLDGARDLAALGKAMKEELETIVANATATTTTTATSTTTATATTTATPTVTATQRRPRPRPRP